jgi:hypothetical protein
MTLVMEAEIKDYRLERWIAVILALMFFLPFVASAEESPMLVVSSRDGAPDAPFAWRCRSTGIDGFDQCALMLDGKVLTWRMAPAGQELSARLRSRTTNGVEVEISRNGRDWRSHLFSHSAQGSS